MISEQALFVASTLLRRCLASLVKKQVADLVRRLYYGPRKPLCALVGDRSGPRMCCLLINLGGAVSLVELREPLPMAIEALELPLMTAGGLSMFNRAREVVREVGELI